MFRYFTGSRAQMEKVIPQSESTNRDMIYSTGELGFGLGKIVES